MLCSYADVLCNYADVRQLPSVESGISMVPARNALYYHAGRRVVSVGSLP
jgi:hypothetical protein